MTALDRRLVPALLLVAVAALVAIRLTASPADSSRPGQSTQDVSTGSSRERAPEPSDLGSVLKAAPHGISFTEVSRSAGLTRPQSPRPGVDDASMTAALTVVDIDGDGWPDIYMGRQGDSSSLYRNNRDGTFTDVADELGLAGSPDPGSGPAVFFDADGDGLLDAYIASAGFTPGRFLRGTPSGSFIERTAEAGFPTSPVPTGPTPGVVVHGLTVGDLDLDGDLDLVVLHWDTSVPIKAEDERSLAGTESNVCARTRQIQQDAGASGSPSNLSRVWLNQGDGTFVDGNEALGLDLSGVVGFTPVFTDVDGDRFPDLLATGDACTSRLFRNLDGRRFVDVTETAGVGTDENGMGSVVRDLDGDGHPDWFITSIGYPTRGQPCRVIGIIGCSGNRLYLNNGDGTFRDETDRYGVRWGGWGWGAAIEDFGNVGELSIVMTNGYRERGALQEPDERDETWAHFEPFIEDPMRFWVRSDAGMSDASEAVGLRNRGVGVGLVAFDYDLDGDLDIVITRNGDTPLLYRNDSPERSWIRIRLVDRGNPANRSGIGSRVAVTRAEQGAPITAELQTGGSYEAQHLPEMHIGLGELESVDRIDVWWPGDSEPQTLRDVPSRQVVTITRP